MVLATFTNLLFVFGKSSFLLPYVCCFCFFDLLVCLFVLHMFIYAFLFLDLFCVFIFTFLNFIL